MGDCVKMIRREALRLPGGYPVPLALCIESYFRTLPQKTTLSEDAARMAYEAMSKAEIRKNSWQYERPVL